MPQIGLTDDQFNNDGRTLLSSHGMSGTLCLWEAHPE